MFTSLLVGQKFPLVVAGIFGLGTGEMVLVFGALLLLFGGSKLPQLGSSLGASIRNFKRGFSGETDDKDEKKVGSGESVARIESPDSSAPKS